MQVDDHLLSGGNTNEEAGTQITISEVLADGIFKLHEQNSNEKELEAGTKSNRECKQTWVKTQLRVQFN